MFTHPECRCKDLHAVHASAGHTIGSSSGPAGPAAALAGIRERLQGKGRRAGRRRGERQRWPAFEPVRWVRPTFSGQWSMPAPRWRCRRWSNLPASRQWSDQRRRRPPPTGALPPPPPRASPEQQDRVHPVCRVSVHATRPSSCKGMRLLRTLGLLASRAAAEMLAEAAVFSLAAPRRIK